MVLEIDNIIRSIEDIRKAALLLRARTTDGEARRTILEIETKADETEFIARGLEYKLDEKEDKS